MFIMYSEVTLFKIGAGKSVAPMICIYIYIYI